MNAAATLPRVTPKRILIAEDDLLAAQALRLALAVDGHAVDVVEDGEQALILFGQKDHDLVITDFKLPKVDGLELAEAIKRVAPSRPVILISAYAETLRGQSGEVSNVDVLLDKPISVVKLQQALVKVFTAPVRGSAAER